MNSAWEGPTLLWADVPSWGAKAEPHPGLGGHKLTAHLGAVSLSYGTKDSN